MSTAAFIDGIHLLPKDGLAIGQKKCLIEMADAVVVTRNENSEIQLHEAISFTPEGADRRAGR